MDVHGKTLLEEVRRMGGDIGSIAIVIGVMIVVGGTLIGLVWMSMQIQEHGLWRDW